MASKQIKEFDLKNTEKGDVIQQTFDDESGAFLQSLYHNYTTVFIEEPSYDKEENKTAKALRIFYDFEDNTPETLKMDVQNIMIEINGGYSIKSDGVLIHE